MVNNNNGIVKLNVGGKLFQTTLTTLQQKEKIWYYPTTSSSSIKETNDSTTTNNSNNNNSSLSTNNLNNIDQSQAYFEEQPNFFTVLADAIEREQNNSEITFELVRDEQGNIFIDRDPTYFHYILNYLRACCSLEDCTLPFEQSTTLSSFENVLLSNSSELSSSLNNTGSGGSGGGDNSNMNNNEMMLIEDKKEITLSELNIYKNNKSYMNDLLQIDQSRVYTKKEKEKARSIMIEANFYHLSKLSEYMKQFTKDFVPFRTFFKVMDHSRPFCWRFCANVEKLKTGSGKDFSPEFTCFKCIWEIGVLKKENGQVGIFLYLSRKNNQNSSFIESASRVLSYKIHVLNFKDRSKDSGVQTVHNFNTISGLSGWGKVTDIKIDDLKPESGYTTSDGKYLVVEVEVYDFDSTKTELL
ncbi:hypothetical protein ABK040_005936 [Willaertia magna]